MKKRSITRRCEVNNRQMQKKEEKKRRGKNRDAPYHKSERDVDTHSNEDYIRERRSEKRRACLVDYRQTKRDRERERDME